MNDAPYVHDIKWTIEKLLTDAQSVMPRGFWDAFTLPITASKTNISETADGGFCGIRDYQIGPLPFRLTVNAQAPILREEIRYFVNREYYKYGKYSRLGHSFNVNTQVRMDYRGENLDPISKFHDGNVHLIRNACNPPEKFLWKMYLP